jgi:hypothetical protein
MEENIKPCNFLYEDVIEASVHYKPYVPLPIQIKNLIIYMTGGIHSRIHAISDPEKSTTGATSKTILPSPENNPLNLQPGEWVQVKSVDEIYQILDEKRKYKGLYFMPAMEKFCGKKFKVFKIAKIIKLESTGEIRKLKSPSVFLEGVYCNGERHSGCDRSCFHFWREAWLKRPSD